MVQATVRNKSDAPVGELGVKVRGGLYAAQPPWVPADSTTTVTFWVPMKDQWWIAVNGIGFVDGSKFQREGRQNKCMIELSANKVAVLSCPGGVRGPAGQ
jgi:hypothetical protein